jgi:flagellar biosynthesis chaperone FliJ
VSDLRALREVEGIRVRRVDDAEDQLRRAQQRQVRAREALAAARQALADYREKLPKLIEQVYADCIDHLVSREFLADKVYEETQLRARVEDFKAQVTEAEKELEAASQAVQQAQQRLNAERMKLDALRELIGVERKHLALATARLEAKALDDLAGAKFVRRQAARAAQSAHP